MIVTRPDSELAVGIHWELSIFIIASFIRALLVEGLPKDVRSGLLREPVTHWNLILPQIICYIVVLKVLKLQIEWSLAYLFFNLALS